MMVAHTPFNGPVQISRSCRLKRDDMAIVKIRAREEPVVPFAKRRLTDLNAV
jgi:hypothetical protein